MLDRPVPDALRFPTRAIVAGYWQALADARGGIPLRASVDPRGLGGALERTFLAERIAPGIARIRIAGMHLADVMGMDVRGMPLSCLIEPPDRDRFAARLERLFAGPCRVEMTLDAARGFGRPPLEGRCLLLPLTGRHGAVDMALGVFETAGDMGRAPRRFAVTGAQVSPLPVPALPATGLAASERMAQPLPGFAEPATASPAPPARRPDPGAAQHLRLVWSAQRPD